MSRPISILFFSRGRGWGHAIPDASIAVALRRYISSFSLEFVSYASGANALRNLDQPVIDIDLPEANEFIETLLKSISVIKRKKTDVIIAHEEFAAILAAHQNQIPSIFLSDWLPPAGSVAAETLSYASSIVLMEKAGLFFVPPNCGKKTKFIGPMVRKQNYTKADRDSIRAELTIPSTALVLLVSPGGWSNEQQAPILETVLSAFTLCGEEQKLLYWVSAKDFDQVTERTMGVAGIRPLRFFDPLDKLMAASDLLITKGTRITTLEAANLGLTSISLSFGQNPIDELLLPRIKSNIALNAKAVDGEGLYAYLRQALSEPICHHSPFINDDAVAAILAKEIGSLLAGAQERHPDSETPHALRFE